MFPYAFRLTCVRERTCEPKKRAKVLLFFDMTKYFLKKMPKNFIFLQNARFR